MSHKSNLQTDAITKPDDLLDEQEAAELLRVKPGTLSVWRSTGRYRLPFIKIGRLVRYRRSALIAWAENRTHDGATA